MNKITKIRNLCEKICENCSPDDLTCQMMKEILSILEEDEHDNTITIKTPHTQTSVSFNEVTADEFVNNFARSLHTIGFEKESISRAMLDHTSPF